MPVQAGEAVGLCLDPHDLGVAKLIANRDKDREFVGALIEAGLLDPELLRSRLFSVPDLDTRQLEIATNWVDFASRTYSNRHDPVTEMFDALGGTHPRPESTQSHAVPGEGGAQSPASPDSSAPKPTGPQL